jgi:hypothetical protein
MQQKLQSWGDILVSMRSWWLQDFKNAGHCPLKTTGSHRNCKKTVQIGLSILNPNFSEIALFGGNLGKVGIVEFNSSSN